MNKYFSGFLEDPIINDISASKVVDSRGKGVSLSLHVAPVPKFQIHIRELFSKISPIVFKTFKFHECSAVHVQ